MKRRASLLAAALLAAAFCLPAAAQEGRTPKVGEMFPDFRGATHDGKEVSLSDYRGKVLLIDFWATWCGPCIAELPHVRKAHGAFHDEGFEVLGISLDRKREALAKWYDDPEKTLPWPSLYGEDGTPNELAERFNIMAIPATFLLNKRGEIVATNLRGRRLHNEVAKLLDPTATLPLPEDMLKEWIAAEDEARRSELAKSLASELAEDQAEANALAWGYLDGESHGEPTAEGAALCLAFMKPTLEGDRDWQHLDTVALAAYLSGDAKLAAELQGEAIEKGREETKGRGYAGAMEDAANFAEIFARQALYLAKSGETEKAAAIVADMESRHAKLMERNEHFKAAKEALAPPASS